MPTAPAVWRFALPEPHSQPAKNHPPTIAAAPSQVCSAGAPVLLPRLQVRLNGQPYTLATLKRLARCGTWSKAVAADEAAIMQRVELA